MSRCFFINQFVFLCVSCIQYKTSKEGSTMGITVSNSAMLAHCHALTQACGYTEGLFYFCIYFLSLQASIYFVGFFPFNVFISLTQ